MERSDSVSSVLALDNDAVGLEHAIEAISNDEEIRGALAGEGVGADRLKRELHADASLIRQQVATEEASAIESRRALRNAEAARDESFPDARQRVLRLLVYFGLLAFFVGAIEGAVSALGDAPFWVQSAFGGPAWMGVVLILVVGVVTACVVNVYESRAADTDMNSGVASLKLDVEQAEAALAHAQRIAVVEQAREIIARLTQPLLSGRLEIIEAPGLAELHGTEYVIGTESASELARIMNAMHGGTIGIAGPRGSGKTTLIGTVCDQAQVDDDSLGLAVSAPVRYETATFLTYLFERLCEACTGPISDLDLLHEPAAGPLRSVRNLRPSRARSAAFQNLRSLRLQRAYSTGRSGELTVLNVFKLASSGDRQVSFLPWGLPQLVDRLRGFLEELATDGRVVIGVDELDKIAEPAKAEQFLHDLKAVFGIPNVWFLVSVSEEALASFEQRGVILSDAFDSALDQVMAVGPLSLMDGVRLLQRRVIGMPLWFSAFAVVCAGGLPRESIRMSRACIAASHEGDTRFAAVAGRIAAADLRAANRAVLATAGTWQLHDHARALWLDDVPSTPIGPQELSVLLEQMPVEATSPELEQALRAGRLRCLWWLTVLETFASFPDSAQAGEIEDRCAQLIQIRSDFRRGVDMATTRIEMFRRESGLAVAAVS